MKIPFQGGTAIIIGLCTAVESGGVIVGGNGLSGAKRGGELDT